jgi:hypothetical protein
MDDDYVFALLGTLSAALVIIGIAGLLWLVFFR